MAPGPEFLEEFPEIFRSGGRQKFFQTIPPPRQVSLDARANKFFEVLQVLGEVEDAFRLKRRFIWEPMPIQAHDGYLVA